MNVAYACWAYALDVWRRPPGSCGSGNGGSIGGFPIPAGQARSEIRVLNSRFIATAAPAFSVDEARQFVVRIRREFADASHNVSAYLIGHGASVVAHCSDDGEPAGTAGRPALAALQGSGLGDVVVVVTRYFGGTKLGTGGLVRAYGDAVHSVLQALPRAQKVATVTVRIVAAYALYARIRRIVGEAGGVLMDETFDSSVAVTARLPVDDLVTLQGKLRDASSGTIQAEVVATQDAAIWPDISGAKHGL